MAKLPSTNDLLANPPGLIRFGSHPLKFKFSSLPLFAAIFICGITWGMGPLPRSARADERAELAALEKNYDETAAPLLHKYCHACHSEKLAEADVDLEAFKTLADVRKHPQIWVKVREMLESGQMPPRDAKQPSDDERMQLKSWVRGYLLVEAKSRAGDPGRVVVRRLTNAEYTYTIRDLTEVASLQPAKEFPVDGAAGEGFTNSGNALVMSPALITKYLDAGKDIAAHVVLLPDGFRFSPSTSRRDWTEEVLTQIRTLYNQYTDPKGGTQVNLQGIVSETNTGGRIPLELYIKATIIERDSLTKREKTIAQAAAAHGLNAKYLEILWQKLNSKQPSLVLDGIRRRWRAAKPDDAPSIVAEIAAWQQELWRFATVGHIGKVGGPKSWMETVTPLISRHEIRYKIPDAKGASDSMVTLVVTDAGDGNEHDFVVWENPRLVAPGRPDLPLRDVQQITRELASRRTKVFAQTARYLAAASEAAANNADLSTLAKNHEVDQTVLASWLDYLGIGGGGALKVEGHFTTKISNSSGYNFINGWGKDETPLIVANSSDNHVRIPGNMKPHGVAVHPSPTLRAAVGWMSPIRGGVRVEGKVKHAHPECGNGVTWSLELRRGPVRRRLATGIAHGNNDVVVGPIENLPIQTGDLVSLLIGPRDGNHSCDLTAVDLQLTALGENKQSWDLAADVSGDIQTANPHADRLGNKEIWHFYTEPEKGSGTFAPVIPDGSTLAKWQGATDPAERKKLADVLQKLLTGTPPTDKESPDGSLYRQLSAPGGPLFSPQSVKIDLASSTAPPKSSDGSGTSKPADYGISADRFGKHPDGTTIEPRDLCLKAPAIVEIRLPADLAAGCELVATGRLDARTGQEGSVQLQVLDHRADLKTGLVPSNTKVTVANGQWSDNNRRTTFGTPIIVNDDAAAKKKVEAAFTEFRDLFPAALCYTKIVPIDEVVTLTLYYREDHHLARLMLDDAQKARLDRLWDELHYISQDALTEVDALAQLIEYATQDADPKVFEPLRGPYNERAAAYRKQLIADEPKQLAQLLAFAGQIYRRPASAAETAELKTLYEKLRQEEIPHDAAFRLVLAKMLVSPAFLYRLEKPASGTSPRPVDSWELATRLSYFLWSSPPDPELRRAAAAGELNDSKMVAKQVSRMMQDPRVRRLAVEFGCQWLHIYDFDRLDEKSESHYPSFVALRGAMYEESIQFFTHLFQEEGSVIDLVNADFTYVNSDLAQTYGIPPIPGDGPAVWRRVDGAKKFGRGGILAQATTLAKQSGASRTSPILRGNWISEVLLGERLPRPPKDVPRLPEDEKQTDGLTVRQLVEKHSSDPKCAVCHQRIDAFGFSLERYDAIGQLRDKDLADRPIETRVKTMDGVEFDGVDGLRKYLLTTRRDAFMRQFCRKLLGYSLGRGVQLSDEPLLDELLLELQKHDYKIGNAIQTIVASKQFREIRGRDAATDD